MAIAVRALLLSAALGSTQAFEALQHLGANSPWFAAPTVNSISSAVPDQCSVDQAIYVVRHGSRYPDPGAYDEWLALHEAVQFTDFTASSILSFISNWSPVLKYPEQQISQVSVTGYKELYNLGADLRFRYPDLYTDNIPFMLWANEYQRTIDYARLFTRGYLGPNASTYGTVISVNVSSPSAIGNSLTPSGQCPNIKDASGGQHASTWDSIYLPPITKRLNRLISGNLTLSDSQVSIFPYLCGFETQNTARRSPWCEVFSETEILEYEYRQDLRYYYGTGPGVGKNMTVMLPVLQGIVELLQKGPNITAKTENNATVVLPPLVVAFTHDNEINELASLLGVFDEQTELSARRRDPNRIYISSRVNPMRGTIAFERLNCGNSTNVRILLNDAVYPLPFCHSGPDKSCPVEEYASYVARQRKRYGSFASICGLDDKKVSARASGAATFFTDLTGDYLRVLKP